VGLAQPGSAAVGTERIAAVVLHDLPRAGIALEYAHAAFAPTADQAAERLLWHEVNSTLPRRFDGEQLLRPGPEVAAAVAGMVDDLIATFRRRAAMQGTRGLADPEGVKRRLLDRLLGMGYLAPFLQNPEYEEIIVNGPRLYVIGGGHKRLIEHIVPEPDETLHLIKRALGPLGARLDESSPVVELGLPDGSRLTAVIPPMTDQIKLTIRKFVLRAQRLETLVALGTLPPGRGQLPRGRRPRLREHPGHRPDRRCRSCASGWPTPWPTRSWVRWC
jgi:hypothetical protein